MALQSFSSSFLFFALLFVGCYGILPDCDGPDCARHPSRQFVKLLPLGSSCSSNGQCASNNCDRGFCACRRDSDCPSGQICFVRLFGVNYCSATSLPLGHPCRKNSQCLSGKCESDLTATGQRCVCSRDSDCPSGQECFRPLFGPNFCSITALPLGSSCTKNDQCDSNKCQGGECVCTSSPQCPSGQTCFTPVLSPNFCSPTNLPIWSVCQKNDQCASNKCEGGRCVCTSNSHCISGQTCFTPLLSQNFCAATNLPMGSSCVKNDQCQTNKCEQGECVCRRNSDCPGSQRCKKPLFSKNYCN